MVVVVGWDSQAEWEREGDRAGGCSHRNFALQLLLLLLLLTALNGIRRRSAKTVAWSILDGLGCRPCRCERGWGGGHAILLLEVFIMGFTFERLAGAPLSLSALKTNNKQHG